MIRFISKSQRIFGVSFSKTDSWLCIYHLFVWSNLNFLHNFQWITPPTQTCLVLYSLRAFAYYVSNRFIFVTKDNIHLLFCCVLSYFDIISPNSVVLCCGQKRISFSLKVSLSYQVLSCEILLACHLKWPYSCFSTHFCFLIIFVLLMLELSVLFLPPRFLCSLFVVVLINRRYLKCWRVLLLLFLTHTVCEHYL